MHALAAPLSFPLPSAPSDTPVVASSISDYPSAAAAIVGVLTQTLQLPVPAYRMEVHADAASFEAALRQHLRLPPESARTAAGIAKAAVGSRRILVNEPLMATIDWPERLVTLAHEMVHATQLELAGHRSLVRNQWLVEGFAEWIAFRVVHELGVREQQTARTSMLARVRGAYRAVGLARLAEMDTLPAWIETRRQRGFDAMYPYAWVVVEFLVQRHSYDAVLTYFRMHRASGDHEANFRAAFGEDLTAFQQALDGHLRQLLD
jgi:hypothetical protein